MLASVLGMKCSSVDKVMEMVLSASAMLHSMVQDWPGEQGY